MNDPAQMILLLGNYRPSLTLARTFKKRGFNIVVGTNGCERLCQYSNAVSSMWAHSPLNAGPSVLAAELKTFAEQNPNLVAIFPVAEEYVQMFANHEGLFSDLPKIVSMRSELIKNCLDKQFMLNLALESNVPTAPFAYETGLAKTMQAANAGVGYPMIIRPKASTERIDGNKAVCVENDDELRECFKANRLEQHEILLQRKFEGKRHNVYFAAVEGEATRVLHAVIDRTDKLNDTGLAVDGRTLSVDHPVVEQTRSLLKALNYDGIGCAQFLVDTQTGATSFLEINSRIAGNHCLPEFAGLDLGWFNFERVVHNRANRETMLAEPNLRYCWTAGDLQGAKDAYMRKEISFASFIGWVVNAIKTAIKSDLHMVFNFKDPYPAIRSIWNLVPRIARWRSTSPSENTIYSQEKQRLT